MITASIVTGIIFLVTLGTYLASKAKLKITNNKLDAVNKDLSDISFWVSSNQKAADENLRIESKINEIKEDLKVTYTPVEFNEVRMDIDRVSDEINSLTPTLIRYQNLAEPILAEERRQLMVRQRAEAARKAKEEAIRRKRRQEEEREALAAAALYSSSSSSSSSSWGSSDSGSSGSDWSGGGGGSSGGGASDSW